MHPDSTHANHSELWSRLEAFDLDGTAPLSFTHRLARDNGWNPAFARRVVHEYKKFVFLAVTCGHPVTPSDEVDQAWHQHLVYTRSYWEELCGQVLGFPLHHGPTKGGAAEGHKFRDWYAQTLQAYYTAFGTMPPADIWPPAAVRFGEAPYFRRVNLRRHWLLPRLQWPGPGFSRKSAGLLALLALVLMGCTAQLPLNPLNWYGQKFLAFYWLLCLTLLPLTLWWRHRGRGSEDSAAAEPSPTTYELVRLAEHGQRLPDSALAALAHAGKIELLPHQRARRSINASPPTDAYELVVWNRVLPEGSTLDSVRRWVMQPTLEAVQALDAGLEAKGWLLPEAERRRLNQPVTLTLVVLGLLGLAKVVVGLTRERPVGFLVATLLGLVVVAFYSYHQRAWATGRGTRVLREAAAVVRQERYSEPVSTQYVALTVGMFGVQGLNILGLNHVAVLLVPPGRHDAGYGGDSGSSGGGDSGCGSSGCGGCGGCGGD
ncbi:TIGR04222 domain-containing membrane protein [Hymenobacter cellulosivorans]|uniref:TIGR04222 domain-containing membrane protein n=1 Tax=Hymenobacter cellulosivorans TaxID=2932249 RepID=A0ABY4F2N4_9BACT|nr:TIGR04222 domain-containing membrane protein [Hymenobacter cellulosivorans]UOQ50749.1 TIGR04222 domain-containing membrane protein [Hymenobacter cellulosivorans]